MNIQKASLLFIFVFFCTVTSLAQKKYDKVDTYWGKVSSFNVTADELKTFDQIFVYDTIKKREISDIYRFRFIVQPIMAGPVKVAETNGNSLSNQMRSFIENPQPGDRIIVSQIFAHVSGEGVRQIPTAIVFVVE
jgi:uncharacterized phage protein gp47/JayE